MTQPTQPAAAAPGTLEIPPVVMPICTRVWAKSPFTDAKAGLTAGEGMLYEWQKPHPFVSTYKIVRMYVVAGGAVEVYSSDGSPTGLRNVLPWHTVLFVEEAMDAPTFVEEMLAAEEGDDEEEEEEEEEEETDPGGLPAAPVQATALVPINGAGGQS